MPYALLLVFFPLIYYFTHPKLHYRHTIDPEIVVLAVYGAMGWFKKRATASGGCPDSLRDPG